jgi:hypothetical protein
VSGTPGDRSHALYEVGQIVMERVGIPKDRWEVAAQLEVLGFRDIDARERLGCADVFDAADRILSFFLDGTLSFVVDEDPAPRRLTGALRALRHYLDGLMFALPMVLQGAAMLLWGFGLWGAIELDVRTGSAIALGFVTSYIATSGFSWAIVSRTLYYHYQSEGALARWSALRMWGVAVRVALLLAVPGVLFNLLYGLLPWDMVLIALLFYVVLVIFWLNWSLIYAVGRAPWLLVVLALSIAAAVASSRVLGLAAVSANVVGMVIACILTFLVGLDGLNRWARDGNGDGNAVINPPRLIVLVYSTAKVFLYGLLYSVFVFADRLVAWTGSRGRDDFPPYPFWLNAPYELAMDLALIVIVLLAGVVEASSHRFSASLIPVGKQVKSRAAEPFLDHFRSLYNRQSATLAIAGLLAIAVAAVVVRALRAFPDPRLQEGLASETTMRVFWVAAVSYAIFMFALRNVLTLMIVMRAGAAAEAIGISVVVNIIVGYAISRSVHYSGAVFGLLAGCVCLALLTHRAMRAVLRDFDYHSYAGF